VKVDRAKAYDAFERACMLGDDRGCDGLERR
jgi:hypothetical protein